MAHLLAGDSVAARAAAKALLVFVEELPRQEDGGLDSDVPAVVERAGQKRGDR